MPLSGKTFHRILTPYVVRQHCENLFVTVMLSCRYCFLVIEIPLLHRVSVVECIDYITATPHKCTIQHISQK